MLLHLVATAAPGMDVCLESILASPDMAHLGALVGRCWVEEQSAGFLSRQDKSAPSWVAHIGDMSAACELWPALRPLPIPLTLQIPIPLMSPLARLQLIALIAVQVGTVGRTHAPWWNWHPRLAYAEGASLAVDPTGLDLRAQDGSSKVCLQTCTPSNLEQMKISHQFRGQWAQCAQIPHQGAIGRPRGARPPWGQDTPPSCTYSTEGYCPAACNSVLRENTPPMPGSNGQSPPLTGRNAPNQARGHWPQKNNLKAVSIIDAQCDWYRRLPYM